MSRRTLRTDDEAGFLMAFCDDLAESEKLFNVQIEVVILRARVRGKIHINCIAYKNPRKPSDAPIAISNTEYPTSAANRLHGGLYRAAIRIGGELSRLDYEHGLEDSPATVV
jgi:hypothetical protein